MTYVCCVPSPAATLSAVGGPGNQLKAITMSTRYRSGEKVRVNLREFGFVPGQVITPMEAQFLRMKGGQRAASFVDTADLVCVAVELHGERVPMAVSADQLKHATAETSERDGDHQ